MTKNIVLLPGDGIGPEVLNEAVKVLKSVVGENTFNFEDHLLGGCSIDAHGTALTDETLKACQMADAVMLGAVGGPKWDDPAAKIRPEQGLLGLRKGMAVFANLRPVKVHLDLADASPLKAEIVRDVDMIVVRELTGGLYFGTPKGRFMEDGKEKGVDTLVYYDYEVERIVRLACKLAEDRKGKVTSVDKANVLESSRLWRSVCVNTLADFPNIELEHMLVDAASMRLISNPRHFDVMVTENMFGDILTDEASVLAGSMGMLPSASLGEGKNGLYEPIHGSAPDIAGKGIANPVGMILSTAMMLRYSLDMEKEALMIEAAVEKAIHEGARTADLGGTLSTTQMTERILSAL
ncbi:MAG: 3-isopropylmalate dehydrogenase [Anaerolineaceae bacterium]|nr:3-isopropylmalate dehydrogenase [Anaerolineaceae bacterium]